MGSDAEVELRAAHASEHSSIFLQLQRSDDPKGDISMRVCFLQVAGNPDADDP